MFFNSFKSKMKKTYKTLNVSLKDKVFPNGEAEFIYVTEILNMQYSNSNLKELISAYGSIYVYSALEKGNYYGILKYAKKKMPDYSDDDIVTMIALVVLNQSQNKNFQKPLLEQLNKFKESIKAEISTFIAIEQHPEIFETKNDDNIGDIDNPILLPGLSGVEKYFSNIVSKDGKPINYKRSGCTYYTDSTTNIDYAIDQYTISTEDGKKICDIFVNEYGTEICNLCPKELKFKN